MTPARFTRPGREETTPGSATVHSPPFVCRLPSASTVHLPWHPVCGRPPSTVHLPWHPVYVRPPSTVHQPQSTNHRQPRTVRCLMSAVHCPLFTNHCQPTTFRCPLSIVHRPLSTAHGPSSSVHRASPGEFYCAVFIAPLAGPIKVRPPSRSAAAAHTDIVPLCGRSINERAVSRPQVLVGSIRRRRRRCRRRVTLNHHRSRRAAAAAAAAAAGTAAGTAARRPVRRWMVREPAPKLISK